MAANRQRQLVPRPLDDQEARAAISAPHHGGATAKQHSEDDWTAAMPHIEQYYVADKRKLKEVMSLMDVRHGFKAT